MSILGLIRFLAIAMVIGHGTWLLHIYAPKWFPRTKFVQRLALSRRAAWYRDHGWEIVHLSDDGNRLFAQMRRPPPVLTLVGKD